MLSRLQELRKEEETLLRIKEALHDQLTRLKVRSERGQPRGVGSPASAHLWTPTRVSHPAGAACSAVIPKAQPLGEGRKGVCLLLAVREPPKPPSSSSLGL